MFYCDKCAELNCYPVGMVKSHGPCEICGAVGVCNDVPTKNLPKADKSVIGEDAAKDGMLRDMFYEATGKDAMSYPIAYSLFLEKKLRT